MKYALIIPALFVTAQTAAAQEIGDVAAGRALAIDNCAECHAVLDDGSNSPDMNATPFPVVANTPGMTEMALSVWFQSPHPTMPNFRIPPDESRALIAYILSLKSD